MGSLDNESSWWRHRLFDTLSGPMGKAVASHVAVARSIPAEAALIYTMHAWGAFNLISQLRDLLKNSTINFRRYLYLVTDIFSINHQIKKSNLSYRDVNFFNEDISWASIEADLFSTNWDMLLTDVKTNEICKININICLENCKKHVLPKKSPRKHQIPRDTRALMRKG